VPVGTLLVVIGGDGSPSEIAPAALNLARKQAPASPPPAHVAGRATPLVKKMAKELDVDLATVIGTGRGGRITEEDVLGAASPTEGRRESLRGVRRLVAEHMTRA